MFVDILKEWIRVTQLHDLGRFLRAEEREPGIQLCGYIFILVFLFKDVKGDENVVMEQLHGQAGIRSLGEPVDVLVREFGKDAGALLDEHDCVDRTVF